MLIPRNLGDIDTLLLSFITIIGDIDTLLPSFITFFLPFYLYKLLKSKCHHIVKGQ